MSDNNKQLVLASGLDLTPADIAKYISASSRNLVVSGNNIESNTVFGSMNFGGTVVQLPKFDIALGAQTLGALIERHEKLKEDDPHYVFLLEELQSRIKNEESRPVVGLEAKLSSANRLGYLHEARIANNKAAKMIARFENVRSYQVIFNYVLGTILTRFNNNVLPLIRCGASEVDVKLMLNATIVDPLYQEVALAGGMMSSDVIDGMIYFLTDKCHVVWN
ncbi:MAG TPA: ABC-three component system protein [Pseudomonas sp.]|uniref:ABC-three component system protein n=1 Tax=Pseudomonas sp. TaxID=306 RepID=UPI002B480B9C|nr:ABC-three component system protein [Pseudomonas sp.]HKS13052.1 ABC-three component system protein [Pseudomonas sp.]